MNYLGKRLIQSLVTVVLVVHVTFFLIQLLPGGPMDYFMGQALVEGDEALEDIATQIELYVSFNPQQPIEEQYVSYMSSVIVGDLGVSIWHREPVTELFAKALPWTVFVMMIGITVSFVLSVVLGSIMAYKEGSKFDFVFTGLSLISSSVPYYIAAILLLVWLGFRAELFPIGGQYNARATVGLNLEFLGSALYHATLPILSIVITGLGAALSMRANSIQILGRDYMEVARLRGLSERRIALRYVGRNAVLPLYTGLMIKIGAMFGGSIILEEIFSYPGAGYYIFQSIGTRDIPVMMGGFLIVTITVVTAMLIADITYSRLDPRATQQQV